MDPQMVWDMMDECDDTVDAKTSLCQSVEKEIKKETFEDKGQTRAMTGAFGFPVWGLNR